ncbi:exodeoxyribonuclease VII small subunit [uncultured Micrococcus sp.]|uniref:exodeoxyribonuclease VII small subunit n=1 Tax=uncultured Micrococcus sp. TaxID=114051 RepID=UPI002593C6DD|nr:exodeoxyribonuclease VII small subunit [uncultured Micrococcus sp.]
MSTQDATTTPSSTPTAVDGFSAADTSDVQNMSYEQARGELVETVQRLEAGGTGLEESLALWERGEALAARCQDWLDGARARLDEVRARAAEQEDAAETTD